LEAQAQLEIQAEKAQLEEAELEAQLERRLKAALEGEKEGTAWTAPSPPFHVLVQPSWRQKAGATSGVWLHLHLFVVHNEASK
jgi:hypothetical protein